MSLAVEAVYEDGVLKPIQPLSLPEHAKVRVVVESGRSWVDETYGIIGWKGDAETLDRLLAEAEHDQEEKP